MFKYIARIAAIIFYLLGLVGSIYIVRIVYGAYQQSDMGKRWVQIPSPAEPLSSLKTGDAGEIFAEGVDGGVYQFLAYPEPTWINVKEIDSTSSNTRCYPITNNTYQFEPMSNKVKLQVSVDCSFAEQAIYQNVDLLENGETWYFEKTSNSYATIGLILFVPIGLIIDVALYVTSLFFLTLDIIITFRRKSKQAANQKI
ncbi:MAG: hypothetical protein U0V02_04700 [Anaerolineales bacterium]